MLATLFMNVSPSDKQFKLPGMQDQHKPSTEVVTDIENLNISPGLSKRSQKSGDANHMKRKTDIHCGSRSRTHVLTFSAGLAFSYFECDVVIVYQQCFLECNKSSAANYGCRDVTH